MRRIAVLALCALASSAALAATPEIKREVGTPQANGVVHLVRGLPEACAWIQGSFTGDPAAPYRLTPARTSPDCQARARLVDAAKVRPSEAKGWKLNDVVRIPSKDCAGLQAVVEIWRKPSSARPIALDAQGRARVYLQDAKANTSKAPAPPAYAAVMRTDGRACR
ncbi:MAG TPA: hypothetical protein VIG88_06150 [Lysobacter sp.]